MKYPSTPAPASGAGTLSPTEQKVARQVALLKSNKEIADALGMSQHTVEKHMQHIMIKKNVPNRVGVAEVAIHEELITVEAALGSRLKLP